MILKGADAARYFAKPDPAKAGLLVFGADGMRVALRRQEVVAALIGPEGPAEMRLTRMAAGDLRKEPSLLSDAMRAIGFFPGQRVVLVEDASDTLSETFAAMLAEWRPGDAQMVVTAGGLTGKSTLKGIFDRHPMAVSIGLYDDPPSREEVEAALRQNGLSKLDSEAQDAVMSLARTLEPGDFRQLLEKVALYKLGDPDPLTAKEVDALAPATIEAEVGDLVQVVAERRAAEVGALVRRLEGQGVQPVALCIGALRHFRTLYAMSTDSGSGARPRGNFRQQESLQRQSSLWTQKALESAMSDLVETDLALRSTSRAPGMAMMERALLRLAMTRG